MLPIFILDDSPVPARFGLTASLWANQQQLPLWSLRPRFDGDFADSYQHVARAGYCVTSGLFRSDTLQHETRDIGQLPTCDAVIVVAATDAERVAHLPGLRFFSQTTGAALLLRNGNETLLHFAVDANSLPSSPDPLRIGLFGSERDQRDAYPANLAALQAAADYLGVAPDIRFLSPAALSDTLHELDDLHGVVLPGGASMAVVRGQIAVAHATLQRNIPTLGLCLGMQSMCTAAVQRNDGFEQAMLAEVAPDAPIHSFVAFDDQRHRCGVLPFPADPPFNLMHYNHRYRFNPHLLPQLAASDIVISAQTGDIVEGIAHPAHRFWQGLQGHPELMSRPHAPHPLFVDFLRAVFNLPA